MRWLQCYNNFNKNWDHNNAWNVRKKNYEKKSKVIKIRKIIIKCKRQADERYCDLTIFSQDLEFK